MAENGSKSNVLVKLILEMVMSRKLKPGDLLPTELELVEMFGGSRLSVREALCGLKLLGIIKSTAGRGTEVAEVDFEQLSIFIGFQLAFTQFDRDSLLDARLALELAAVESLCGNITSEQVSLLQESATSYRDDDLLGADRRLHKQLLEFGGNEILRVFAKLLDIFFLNLPPHKINAHERVFREHMLLISAIEEGNIDLARGILKRHLNYHRESQSLNCSS